MSLVGGPDNPDSRQRWVTSTRCEMRWPPTNHGCYALYRELSPGRGVVAACLALRARFPRCGLPGCLSGAATSGSLYGLSGWPAVHQSPQRPRKKCVQVALRADFMVVIDQ